MKVNIYGLPIDHVLMAVGCVTATAVTIKLTAGLLTKVRLAKKREARRNKRDEVISALRQKLETIKPSASKCKDILDLDIVSLREKLKAGELNPKEVLYAYQDKALSVHEKTNCIVDIIEEAEQYIDELLESGNKDGLLYGIPVSIKEHQTVKGYDVTLGLTCFIDQPADDDCGLVKLLKAEGAIPFVKTNIPHALLSLETTNPIFGSTRNHQDATRSAGGSSGGEGALIGGGGSLLGLAADMAGSARVPSCFNGICGLSPTVGRISMAGTLRFPAGINCVGMTLAPMARDVTGLHLSMKAFCGPRAWELDPTLAKIPYDDKIYNSRSKLRIGYFTTDAYCEAVPAVQRAVMEAKAKLEAVGHEVIEWRLPVETAEIFRLWHLAVFADGGEHVKMLLKDEVFDAAMKDMVPMLRKPKWFKKLFAAFLRPFNPDLSDVLIWSCGLSSVNKWWNLFNELNALKGEVMKSWKTQKLDALICPTFPCLPLTFGEYTKDTWIGELAPKCCIYCMIFNVVNFPCGSLPVTKVTADDVMKMTDYPIHDHTHRMIKKGMEGTEGLIVNVQVATFPWEEELCLRVMKELEEVVDVKA